jgi:hypothetical protein
MFPGQVIIQLLMKEMNHCLKQDTRDSHSVANTKEKVIIIFQDQVHITKEEIY